MDRKVAAEIIELINVSNNILLPLHASPDGDSFGSALAFYFYLKKLGKKVAVISQDKLPEHIYKVYKEDIIIYTDPADYNYKEVDLMICLDINRPGVLSRLNKFSIPSNIKVVNIDHHPQGEEFADIVYREEKRSSASAIVYDFFKAIGDDMDHNQIRLIALGILSDTKFFSTTNTSSSDLKIIAELMDKGLDLFDISNGLSIKPLYIKKYQEVIYRNLAIKDINGYKIAYSYMTNNEMEQAGLKDKILPAGADDILSIENVDFSFFVKEKISPSKSFTISLRSVKSNANLGDLAVHLNGGGHTNAAGGAILEDISMDKAINKIFEIIKVYYNERD